MRLNWYTTAPFGRLIRWLPLLAAALLLFIAVGLRTAPLHRTVLLPAEYEPVQEIVIRWPTSYPEYWPMYRELTQQLQVATRVRIVVPDDRTEREVQMYLTEEVATLDRLEFTHIPTYSIWIRDYGPLYVRSTGNTERLVAVDLQYAPLTRDPLAADDPFPLTLAQHQHYAQSTLPLLLEGGNILSDGAGTCLLTSAVFHRNTNRSEQDIRALLQRELGCTTAMILPMLVGEPTGHIGLYVKLADTKTALVSACVQQSDRNCAILDTIAQQLRDHPTRAGGRYQIIRVPYPFVGTSGRTQLYASYVNGIIVNNYAFVPAFGLPQDAEALHAYQEALPTHTIVPINVAPLLRMGGALQCISLPVPVQSYPHGIPESEGA